MSEWKNQDFSQLTVLELRKVAKAMGVQLGAGISKAGIVEKLDARATQNTATSPLCRWISPPFQSLTTNRNPPWKKPRFPLP